MTIGLEDPGPGSWMDQLRLSVLLQLTGREAFPRLIPEPSEPRNPLQSSADEGDAISNRRHAWKRNTVKASRDIWRAVLCWDVTMDFRSVKNVRPLPIIQHAGEAKVSHQLEVRGYEVTKDRNTSLFATRREAKTA